MSEIKYRKAEVKDFDNVCKFVDKWLSGRALKEGGGNDYFVTKNQHKAYFKNCVVYVAIDKDEIVGWGVKGRNNVLNHLLVNAHYRGKGIGTELLNIIKPDIIRSKSDQQTGNPKDFYEKHGYKSVIKDYVGKKNNIELMTK